MIGLILGAAGFSLQGFATTGLVFALGIPLQAIWAIWRPAAQQLMTAQVGADEQGRLQGALSAVQGVACVVGPLVVSRVFALSTARPEGVLPAGAPFLLAGLLLVACAAIGAAATRALSSPAPAGPGTLPAPPGSPASPGS